MNMVNNSSVGYSAASSQDDEKWFERMREKQRMR